MKPIDLTKPMQDLTKKAFSALARFLITFALILFLVAWTLAYWQAWLFVAVFSVSICANSRRISAVYTARRAPWWLNRKRNTLNWSGF